MLEFNSQDLDKVLPSIEEHVRNELGAKEALPYEVGNPGEAGKGSVYWRSVAGGGDAIVLCYLYFDLPGPRLVSLEIAVNKRLVGCHVGRMQYLTLIERAIDSAVYLDAPRFWFWQNSKFLGDERASQKLNGNEECIALANKFSRTKLDLGGGTLRVPRTFELVPKDSGSQLIAVTLPDLDKDFRDGKDGKGLGIRDFFKLADMFEAIL
jgi:hypothetical protein